MRSFIFGAGASHSYHQSPTGVRPPLAKGFFEGYHQLDIACDRYVLTGNIVNYVRETRGVHPVEFGNWNENIENFLTEIDEQVGTKEKALDLGLDKRILYSKAYDEMVFLFASVLNEIQNGPLCASYSSLVSRLDPGDVLITFNWDALLDRVLWESGHWNPADGYGVSFEKFFDNGWKDYSVGVQSRHRLLKPHGSTNWLMPYRFLDLRDGTRRFRSPGVNASQRPLFCFVKSDGPYETYLKRTKTGYAPFSYYYYPPDIPIAKPPRTGYTQVSIVSAFDLPEHGKITVGGHPFLSMPLIIPPVRCKEYGLLGNALDPVWRQAEEALAACDHLTVIGYSFPLTDQQTWDLFRQASDRRGQPLPTTVVDPCPGPIVARIQAQLGKRCDVRVRKCTFSEYVGLE